MSNTTPGINPVSKAQGQAISKATTGKKDQALNFNDLFSSALGNAAPQARLNNIENQLREALLKQEKDKKPADYNSSAEAAQAAVWAQRNWMQNSPVQTNTAEPDAGVREANEAPSARVSNADRQQKETQSSAGVEKSNAEQAQPVKEQTASESADAPQAENETALAASTSSGSSSANAVASSTESNMGDTAAKSLAPVSAGAETVNAIQQQNLTAEPAGISMVPSQTAELNRADNAAGKSHSDATAGGVMDKLQQKMAASENEAGLSENNSMRNTNPVAAQIAPQVAQQMMAAESAETGEEGIQVGQKLTAPGTLLAAGTNGLNGVPTTAGTPQQNLIKTPVNQPGFAKELGQTVQWAIGKNLSTVDIRVNPESFGPMNMRLVQKGQQVQLIIRTQDEASANLLTQALGGLKEVLAQNGLQLNQVQIQHGNTANQQSFASNSQAQAEQNPGHGRQGNHPDHGGTKASPDPVTGNGTNPPATPKGKLDLFA